MQSQNCRRAPAWTEREVQDLIALWGDESMLAELCWKKRNAKTFEKISNGMKDRGYNRDPQQCPVKIKELRQAYQKTREANSCSGSEPQTCHFYDELLALRGGPATTTPTLCFDSIQGVGGNTEAGFGGEEEEVVDSSQRGSGETGFPNSQDLFITPELEPVPLRTHPRDQPLTHSVPVGIRSNRLVVGAGSAVMDNQSPNPYPVCKGHC
ncbi:hypothetical protein UY3_08121 [Chelonia mydas]|uniref:Myb/SANT-like DNA-binding domain-containing protein n=1 Tax=Chelonia mydas TaxID=8469 RepID=M7BRI1_CHEMY|nr:hypothetical protein UY3_08121 [Chelonia mydas]